MDKTKLFFVTDKKVSEEEAKVPKLSFDLALFAFERTEGTKKEYLRRILQEHYNYHVVDEGTLLMSSYIPQNP